jgi:acid phosphatase type 7
MKKRLWAILGAVVCLADCSGSPSAPGRPTTAGSGNDGPPPISAGPPAVLVGSGDIADCGPGAAATAALLDRFDGTIFTTGDNAYPSGSRTDYQNCYEPTWGRHKSRTRPAPGNHEYTTPFASAYFEYFGANAGPFGVGYYSYSLGAWHVISLNSEIDVGSGSTQLQWLRADIAANPSRCTAVYWHRPLFSSGEHGGDPRMQEVWRTLYDLDVDLAITGHDHLYERFAPQDAGGRADWVRGIRQFVVGTGGARVYALRNIGANSEAAASVLGVLAFTLESDRYAWRFVAADGSFHDEGATSCH